MSHKDAPPLTDEQQRFEAYWRNAKGDGFVGFGRDKNGVYLSEFARDAWVAWQWVKQSHLTPV